MPRLVRPRSAAAEVVRGQAYVTAEYGSMAIRKMAEIAWRPTYCIHYGANSVGLVIRPAGAERAVGLTSAAYMKDPTDAAWGSDAGMREWRTFMARYMPEGDLADANHVYGYSASRAMHQVLRQRGEDLSRENIMRQAASLVDLEIPTLLPGIKVIETARVQLKGPKPRAPPDGPCEARTSSRPPKPSQ